MFNRLSEIIQTASDVVAPPPSPLQDFEYHWRKIKQFYVGDTKDLRMHILDTIIPKHLDKMLDILLNEDTADRPGSLPCMEFVLINRPLDLMIDLALSDSPPGMMGRTLSWLRRFLANSKRLALDHPSIYQPVLKLFNHTMHLREPVPVPVLAYEREAVFFLVAVAAAILVKPSDYPLIFVNTHYEYGTGAPHEKPPQKNALFDSVVIEAPSTINIQAVSSADQSNSAVIGDNSKRSCCDGQGQFLPLAALCQYLYSPNHEVVLKASEGVLILLALCNNQLKCESMFNSFECLVDELTKKLVHAYSRVPDDMDSLDIELETVSWTLNTFDSGDRQFIGRLPLVHFLSWLDFLNCAVREIKSEKVSKYAVFKFSADLLHGQVSEEVTGGIPCKITLLTKVISQVGGELRKTCVDWLLEDSEAVFREILGNATECPGVLTETLSLVEVFVDEPNPLVLDALVLRYLKHRTYYNPQMVQSWSDEEDERERRRGSHENCVRSKTLAPNNILKVINNLLLLLPKQILGTSAGTGYEEYVHDASAHYRNWIDQTRDFEWPTEAVSSDNFAESCEFSTIASVDTFYEGPLLNMLFHYVRNIASQPYGRNLAVIAIISKLALFPHPYLHEVLLNPELPVIPGANTLWNALTDATKLILAQVPLIDNFKSKIEATSRRLLNPESSAEDEELCSVVGDDTYLFEAVIVLEEFAKELAAIAFVKYHYSEMDEGETEKGDDKEQENKDNCA